MEEKASKLDQGFNVLTATHLSPVSSVNLSYELIDPLVNQRLVLVQKARQGCLGYLYVLVDLVLVKMVLNLFFVLLGGYQSRSNLERLNFELLWRLLFFSYLCVSVSYFNIIV